MSTTTADARSATLTDQSGAGQLRRSGDRMLAGVAGGIARYLNTDVALVRVIIAALALFTGVGAALYIAAWQTAGRARPPGRSMREMRELRAERSLPLPAGREGPGCPAADRRAGSGRRR